MNLLPPPFPSLTSDLDCRWLDATVWGRRGEQGMAYVMANEGCSPGASHQLSQTKMTEISCGNPSPCAGRAGWGQSCQAVPFWVMLPAVSCGCVCCLVLANFLSMRVCASVMRKTISEQTHKVSWGTDYIKAFPGSAKSRTVLLFLLGFLLWMDFEDRSCRWALFLSCLVSKDLCCAWKSGLCRIHSS